LIRNDFNTITYNGVAKTTGLNYSYLIYLYNPLFCQCSTFLDRGYCHHILAINILNIANLVIDPSYKAPDPPRRLVARKSKRGRPTEKRAKCLVKKIKK